MESVAVWGASGKTAFAVGEVGTILFFDGAHWVTMASPTDNALTDVWGSSVEDVWAVGPGVTLRFDGRRWRTANSIGGTDVWCSSESPVYVVDRYRIWRYKR